jgi:Flp pilus assembly protein TadB
LATKLDHEDNCKRSRGLEEKASLKQRKRGKNRVEKRPGEINTEKEKGQIDIVWALVFIVAVIIIIIIIIVVVVVGCWCWCVLVVIVVVIAVVVLLVLSFFT